MLDYKKVGDFLYHKRKALGLTQTQIADQLHISFQAVSRWEKGLSIPTAEMLLNLSKIYNVSVDEILNGKENYPIFSYEKSGMEISKIDSLHDNLKNHMQRNIYNPSFRGDSYDLSEFSTYKQPQLVSIVQEFTTKQRLALEYGYIDQMCEDTILTLINTVLVLSAKPLYITTSLNIDQYNIGLMTNIMQSFCKYAQKYNFKVLTGQNSIKPKLLKKDVCLLTLTMTAIAQKEEILSYHDINAGDIMIGIESNGLHFYGAYQLIDSLIDAFPEIKKETINNNNFIDEIMKPQINYDFLKKLIKEKLIKGAVYIAGLGIPRNLNRIIPEHLDAVIDLKTIKVPQIFSLVRSYSKMSDEEMFNTFNCGVGYIVIVSKENKELVFNYISNYYHCFELGKFKKGNKQLIVKNNIDWRKI